MAGTERTLTSGLWHGVRNTSEPFDDTPDLLQDATNIVIPDPQAGSGAYGRPAFRQYAAGAFGRSEEHTSELQSH